MAGRIENFAEAKALLLQGDVKCRSAYDDIADLVHYLLEEKAPDGVDGFEDHLRIVKNTRFNPVKTRTKFSAGTPVASAELLARSQKVSSLLKRDIYASKKPLSKAVPDVLAERDMLAWAGAGLPQGEAYRLNLALRKLLSERNDVASLRFFGVIYGKEKNYIVLEGLRAATPKFSTRNFNYLRYHNQFVYFVCNQIGDEWNLLPDLSATDVVLSNGVRKYLSGNLEAEVRSLYPFPGREKNYLRAQLARIASETVIVPKEYFSVQEPEEPEEGVEPEERKIVVNPELNVADIKDEDLAELSGWTYLSPSVASITKIPKEKQEKPAPVDGEEEEPAEEEEETEEPPELLAPIPDEHGEYFHRRATSHSKNPSAPSLVRSAKWPGAVTVYKGAFFVNFYAGFGLEKAENCFELPALPQILSEVSAEEEPKEVEDLPLEEGKAEGEGEEEEEAEE